MSTSNLPASAAPSGRHCPTCCNATPDCLTSGLGGFLWPVSHLRCSASSIVLVPDANYTLFGSVWLTCTCTVLLYRQFCGSAAGDPFMPAASALLSQPPAAERVAQPRLAAPDAQPALNHQLPGALRRPVAPPRMPQLLAAPPAALSGQLLPAHTASADAPAISSQRSVRRQLAPPSTAAAARPDAAVKRRRLQTAEGEAAAESAVGTSAQAMAEDLDTTVTERGRSRSGRNVTMRNWAHLGPQPRK